MPRRTARTRMNNYVRRLNRLAQAYRATEEKIVGAYFKEWRSKADHVYWLSAHAFKEYSAIKPIFTALAKLYPQLDREIDRHDFEELTEHLAYENKLLLMVYDQ